MDKVAMLVEDRDTGWLFTDVGNAPVGAVICSVDIADGIPISELENERVALWQQNEEGNQLRVVPFEGYDFAKCPDDDDFFPIPSPTIVADKAEYERQRAE